MNKQFLTNMLELQDKMNRKVYPEWNSQNFQWYRAIWIECGELVEHYGYKWWKKQTPDMDQVKLEVIDIWHFGMSDLLNDIYEEGGDIEELVWKICKILEDYKYTPDVGVLNAAEKLASVALDCKGFGIPSFFDLMHSVGMDFDELYRQYIGKNVLNFFRQDNGYKDGTYIKIWNGREDNEYLVEILNKLDCKDSDFSEKIYKGLKDQYDLL